MNQTINNLLEAERLIKETTEKIKETEEQFGKDVRKLVLKLADYEKQKEILMSGFDLLRINNAKKYLYTEGVKKNFYGEALSKVKEAISDVTRGCLILKKQYIGCKNYDRFIGQGVNVEYGFCPRHGSVVMEIGLLPAARRIDFTDEQLSDMLYFLNLLTTETGRKILFDNE